MRVSKRVPENKKNMELYAAETLLDRLSSIGSSEQPMTGPLLRLSTHRHHNSWSSPKLQSKDSFCNSDSQHRLNYYRLLVQRAHSSHLHHKVTEHCSHKLRVQLNKKSWRSVQHTRGEKEAKVITRPTYRDLRHDVTLSQTPVCEPSTVPDGQLQRGTHSCSEQISAFRSSQVLSQSEPQEKYSFPPVQVYNISMLTLMRTYLNRVS